MLGDCHDLAPPRRPVPALTLTLPGGCIIALSHALDGGFGVVLFHRGSWARTATPSSAPSSRPDSLLALTQPDTAVYSCGPEQLLSAVEALGGQRGLAVHVKRFAPKPLPTGENIGDLGHRMPLCPQREHLLP
jgi:hypothetical protein